MRRLVFLMLVCSVVACGASSTAPTQAPPTLDTSAAEQPTAAPPPTQATPTLWIDPGVPPVLVEKVRAAAPDFAEATDWVSADLKLMMDPGPEAVHTATWVYALAGRFDTVPDSVAWADFESYWRNADSLVFDSAPAFAATTDVVDLLILRVPPELSGEVALQLADAGNYAAVPELAWANPQTLTVLPFDALDPSLKVLTVDGQSPLNKSFNRDSYPLTVRFGVEATTEAGNAAANAIEGWPQTNYDPAQLGYVVLTGTTAIARATAMQVEFNGVTYPAAEIAPFFSDADILHTSNESSYARDCPPPDWTGEPKFCSQRKYFDVLTATGVDIVEKTGNHISDYGLASLTYTLDVYDGNDMVYYGGGRNITDALTPRILTLPDGTRVAFLGCNSAGPFQVWATEASAGAAPCGENFSAIIEQIEQVEADVIIVTLQYIELPSYEPSDQQVAEFQLLAEAGADIISGSQAHQPQGFGFTEDTFIHYGIGNLFFDQMDFIENRQMFADKHVIYAGEHISTILFTGLMYEWAQPRPMTPEERTDFLQTIFNASPGYLE